MKLNSLKSFDFSGYNKVTNTANIWNSFRPSLSSQSVILSGYSCSIEDKYIIYILSNVSNLKGKNLIASTYNTTETEYDYNPYVTLTGINDIKSRLTQYGGVNSVKLTNTLNSLHERYGELYYYQFIFGQGSEESATAEYIFEATISNSFHIKDKYDSSGKIS